MNDGLFIAEIKRCESFLKSCDLLEKTIPYNIQMASENKYKNRTFRELAKKEDYSALYMEGMSTDEFDYLLKKDAFIQFSFDMENGLQKLRMAFYPSPSLYTASYEEFLQECFPDEDTSEIGEEFWDEYEQKKAEAESKQVSPCRYDYCERLYKEKVHSVSHIHFGHEEDIRIPIKGVLSPLAFTKFIIQYYYYDVWKEKVNMDDPDFFIHRNQVLAIERDYFTEKDRLIPYINIEGFVSR